MIMTASYRQQTFAPSLQQGVKYREPSFTEFYKFNYPQRVCTVVYGVGYSPFPLYYILLIILLCVTASHTEISYPLSLEISYTSDEIRTACMEATLSGKGQESITTLS